MAAIALVRELDANLVHQWLRNAAVVAATAPDSNTGFIEVTAPGMAMPSSLPQPALAQRRDIRIELRRGATSITVALPLDAAAQCGAWPGELLR